MFYWHHPEALALAVEAWSRHTEPEVKASGVGGATLNQKWGVSIHGGTPKWVIYKGKSY